jgi:hypothetical protein
MRIVTTVAVAALAGLLWAGVCLAIGLPVAVTVAGAVVGAAGGFLAAAICVIGAGADARDAAETAAEREQVVALVPGERFSREGTPSPSKDRVA